MARIIKITGCFEMLFIFFTILFSVFSITIFNLTALMKTYQLRYALAIVTSMVGATNPD
jgi:hypothetical protein